ncbi:hypothetical protein BDR26DRAFT_852580 [Obelidium mucronatum]|nr:hypothetical protein BDR26DRAFT_852580 [Obelidium mucronatum]
MQFGLVDMDPLQSDIFNDLFQQNPSLQQPQQFITPPTLLQFDTFVGTHADLNLENLLEIQNVNLEQLLNAPLPVPPSSEEVIQPHFSGIKSKLKIIPSLAAHPEVSSHVDKLIQWYIRYTDFQTRETNPVQCRITLGKIKRSQNEILEYCSDHVDRFLVEKMFDRVKREYSIKTDKEFPDPFEFIRHLRNVSALSNDGDTLDQLCRLYEEFTLHKEQRPVLDAQIRRIQKTLVGKCVTQMDLDEVKFTFDCLEDIFYL